MEFVDRMMCRRLTVLLLSMLTFLPIHGQSVLSSGDWYKVSVNETGIYKLDRSFLNDLGLPVNSLDPRTIKVFGNGGGGILPQSNDEARAFDLTENAILAVGEADGTLDNVDYFLFYGQNPDKIEWTESGINYEQNFYSDESYYFITFGNANGLRIESKAGEVSQGNVIDEFNDVIIYENEDRNILRSGRRWFGENMSPAAGLSRSFDFNQTNVTSLENIHFTGMAQSQESCSIDVLVNNDQVGNLQLQSIPFGVGSAYSAKGRENSGSYPLSGSGNEIEVDFQFNPNGGTSISYIDHFEIELKRALRFEQSELHFRSIESINNTVSTYEIEGMNDGDLIWDVTDPLSPQSQEYSLTGSKGSFSSNSDIIREYVAVRGANHPYPKNEGEVSNQNLKGNTSLDGIIVTHPDFLEVANQLADFHRSHDGLSIQVATTQQVYNEFSSGRLDVSSIRDYAKYVYDQGSTLKYLLLIGDTSFDYKGRDGIPKTNFVPIYQSRDWFSPIFSHSSDDYFGFLEDHEGLWDETTQGDHTMEIGVGRIPVKTAEEAQTAVDKIIRYSTRIESLGNWRTDFVYVVDDGDANIHVDQAEDLSEIVDLQSDFNTKKLYLDAFDQVINPSNERSPIFAREITQSLNKGTLFLNFLGHGNEDVWMDENVLVPETVADLRNYQRLPIIVTATCEFGRYDDPFQFSGAERLLLSDQGAVALLTTTRPVFAHTNFVLNEAFHNSVLSAADNPNMRLGDIIRETKNNGLQGPVNRNFALLGDPMLRPAYPKLDIALDQFVGETPETLSALEIITLTGTIQNNGVLQSDFDGVLEIELFDIPMEKITKGQQSAPFTFQERDNALYRGTATVNNGTFSHEFRLPRNISYKNQPGKLVMYAYSEESGLDASGGSKNIIIGGTADAEDDNAAPRLEVYLNEPFFKNGSRVGSGAMLIAKFSDESGMNVSNSGFDRGITLDLNGEIIELNDFYTADLDDYTHGTVLYPLQDLEPGTYRAVIKGSDTYNNPTSESVDFVVSDQPILQTFNFNAYPNPANYNINFRFEHDREGEPLRVDLILYSMNGEQSFISRNEIDFSLRNELINFDWSNKRIMDGIYAYKLSIKSLSDGAETEHFGRLVIRN